MDVILFSHIDQRLRQIFKKPKEPFGGISMIVVGDLIQLRPVSGSYIFKRDTSNAYTRLQPNGTNRLWDLFDFIELTEIMRQREDKVFAEALTKLGNQGLIGLSDDQVKLFNSRIVRNVDEIPQYAIHPFKTNINVDKFNKAKIEKLPGQLFINKAEHIVKGNEAAQREARGYMIHIKNLNKEKSCQLPSEIALKVGAKYMMTANKDLADGLVNGACGILKSIELNDEKTQAKRVYIDYMDEQVGPRTREKHFEKHQQDQNINKEWTPVEPSKVKLKVAENKTWSIHRVQFQLTIAEAITICKIQGATCAAIGLNLKQILSRSELYVALSRVSRLQDLYLYGKKSIVQGQTFIGWTRARRRRYIMKDMETNPVQIELRRLRSRAPFSDKFPFLLEPSSSASNIEITGATSTTTTTTTIMYHRINGDIIKLLPYIRGDYGFTSCDYMILANKDLQISNELNNVKEFDSFKLMKIFK